jgi:Glycosyl transferases group 1
MSGMPSPLQRQVRIALVQQGDPTDAASWSGVPAGLTSGFEDLGCEVVPIDAEFPGAGKVARLLRMSWTDQAASRTYAAACGRTADRALRRAGAVDGVVMLGTGYLLAGELPTVTFEDMTVAQALRRADPAYDSLSTAGAARWRERQRRAYERNRGCCVTSTWVAESIAGDYRIAAEKVHIVGCGHNMVASAAHGGWDAPRFLFVGADWERKRGPAVLEAFAQVHERHPDARLDLVGGHPPVDAAGVTGHGFLSLAAPDGRARYADLLARATCFLMPSTYEPFGIGYLDAAASGVPSIGTTVGGAPDAVGDGGRVVDPTDPGALAQAMLELADVETARRLGELAQARSHLFTWHAVAERLLRALRPTGVEVDALADFLEPRPTVEVTA